MALFCTEWSPWKMENVSLKLLEKFWKFFSKWPLFKYLISSSNFTYSLALKFISHLKHFCRRNYIRTFNSVNYQKLCSAIKCKRLSSKCKQCKFLRLRNDGQSYSTFLCLSWWIEKCLTLFVAYILQPLSLHKDPISSSSVCSWGDQFVIGLALFSCIQSMLSEFQAKL